MKKISPHWARAVTRTGVLFALSASAALVAATGLTATDARAADTQAFDPKPADAETQTAVADYNAGNLTSALAEFRKAADANMSHAQYVYGKMYDDGEFVGRDPAEAHQWFMKAAKQGHVQAELALANQFLDGRGTTRDNQQAFVWYKKAAEGGDMTAQYVTGSFYERGGDGVKQNLNVARAYYAAAAAQGDPAARLKYQQLTTQLRESHEAKPQ
jgi:TPR repeat protein